jgi:hypothetical protein
MMTKNQQIIAAQQELIHRLAWNDAFGCHTRAGFENMIWMEIYHRARWIVFFDVDGVHALNNASGSYAVFDAKIKKVLTSVRSTDIVAGQWHSGDEFLLCMVESPDRATLDPQGLVRRLTELLAAQDLTAVFAVVPVTSPILVENVNPAADEVLARKRARGSAPR